MADDFWTKRLPPALTDYEALARYNAERARGIVHHPQWVERMEQIQQAFNESATRHLRYKDEPRRRWWRR